MKRTSVHVLSSALLVTLLAVTVARAESRANGAAAARPAVAALLEDNAESLLPLLTNPTGDPGVGHVERTTVFSGTSSVKIMILQRFSPNIPGWNYRIVEKPQAPGEFRHVRFAWKAGDGCVGTMVQFHIETGWSVRYVAGQNDPGWGAKTVAAEPPATWTVITRDLFADFGECTITGIALVAFRGQGACFDHVYFGKTVDDLDRIDATGLRLAPPPRLDREALEKLWTELSSDDAAKAYLAFWTLVAGAEQSVPFLKAKLAEAGADADAAQLRQWVRDLDHDDFRVRDRAQRRLAFNIDAAVGFIREELARNPSPESRWRLETLLKANDAPAANAGPVEKARRVLRYARPADPPARPVETR